MKHKFPKPGTLFRMKNFNNFSLTSGDVYYEEWRVRLDVDDIVMFLSHKKYDKYRIYWFLYADMKISWRETFTEIVAGYSLPFDKEFEEIKLDNV